MLFGKNKYPQRNPTLESLQVRLGFLLTSSLLDPINGKKITTGQTKSLGTHLSTLFQLWMVFEARLQEKESKLWKTFPASPKMIHGHTRALQISQNVSKCKNSTYQTSLRVALPFNGLSKTNGVGVPQDIIHFLRIQAISE